MLTAAKLLRKLYSPNSFGLEFSAQVNKLKHKFLNVHAGFLVKYQKNKKGNTQQRAVRKGQVENLICSVLPLWRANMNLLVHRKRIHVQLLIDSEANKIKT